MILSKLLLATTNKGKIVELENLLSPYNLEIILLNNYDILSPEENGLSFSENAELKAKYYGEITNLPTLADDSGFCIEALDNRPGIYSARFARDHNGFNGAIKQLEVEMQNKTNHNAHLVCSLAVWHPATNNAPAIIHEFCGIVEGMVTFPAKGHRNFGYDSIFIPEGRDKTFAEMEPEEKALYSHRTKAFNLLTQYYFHKDLK